jgi:hypothetical protein
VQEAVRVSAEVVPCNVRLALFEPLQICPKTHSVVFCGFGRAARRQLVIFSDVKGTGYYDQTRKLGG